MQYRNIDTHQINSKKCAEQGTKVCGVRCGTEGLPVLPAFQYLKGAYRKDGEGLLTRVCSDRTRGNGCKLKEGRFR